MSARWISLVLSIWWTPDRSSCATQAAEMGACERDSRLPLPTRSLSKLGGPSREHLAAPAHVRSWHERELPTCIINVGCWRSCRHQKCKERGALTARV